MCRAVVHMRSTRRCPRLADPARHTCTAAVQEHEKRYAKVRAPVIADRSACGRVSRGRSSHADELVVHVHRRSASPGRRLRRAWQQVVQVDLVEPMRSDSAESRLVGRVDRCDAQSAKPRAGTRPNPNPNPARDPRPATRVETSVRTLSHWLV